MLTPQPVMAERLNSDSYVIQFGNLNMGAGTQDSASYNVTNTTGQTAAGPFGTYGSTNYFIGSGFQYIYQIGEFSFSLSDIDIDLGVLTTGFNTDSHTMTVSTRGAGGYQVYAYALKPLSNRVGSTIPFTTCDASDCDYQTAGVWTTASNAGFGYNVAGDDADSDFVDSTYFKAFADDSAGQPMQSVMSSSDLAVDETATVTYKASAEDVQAQGIFTTQVVYVAVPGY